LKKEWSYNSTPLLGLRGMLQGELYTLRLIWNRLLMRALGPEMSQGEEKSRGEGVKFW
jgi:hypothetical protein